MAAAPAAAVAASVGSRAPASAAVRSIAAAAELIIGAFRNGGKLLLCGNGGSAADCQHLAAEFVCKLRKTDALRRPLPAIALTTDTSFLTAYANDVGFKDVFARQIEAIGKAGDVLIAISTSGSSPNVLRAIETARAAGIRTIFLTGGQGAPAAVADIAIAVPSGIVAHIQEAHLAIEHLICEIVEERLFPSMYGAAIAPAPSDPV